MERFFPPWPPFDFFVCVCVCVVLRCFEIKLHSIQAMIKQLLASASVVKDCLSSEFLLLWFYLLSFTCVYFSFNAWAQNSGGRIWNCFEFVQALHCHPYQRFDKLLICGHPCFYLYRDVIWISVIWISLILYRDVIWISLIL